ncbi:MULTISPECIES: universal stress protein [Pseudomonas]|jgi:nucleotide-binding universal stress UspA family protein|uniref:Universal stress protein n=1 Tax=Pseudomonas chlororaphis TaxID=587753 RepID=A0AB34C099_9PSED|nr:MULTISPECIES: universal stress protein [Pseudomonas]AMS16858.1 universal stress protein UspA [Pseudomonas chlororaphis]AUG03435.1 universal stress protein [Pseudomonas sp. 09C 129]AZD03635.1 Universal stress protein family [Pseudomonas chlororaphis subsp. chlororaphis]EJK99529.1 universal stress protein family protein [Pseudomonas chlororaphis subsp. aureofaciens 30-84]KAA5839404.1 universal stress protein [Pseudomonas chlororaphis]
MIRSMLYATDLGLYAPYVMQHALELARTFNAELHVVHAVEPMGLFAESVLQSYLDEQALNEFHSQGLSTVMANIEQRVLDSFREELGEGMQDLALIQSVRVFQGDPSHVILEQASKLSVDLLIVGSHSHGAGGETPLGRTAARVLQLAKVPVYLVPLVQRRRLGDI